MMMHVHREPEPLKHRTERPIPADLAAIVDSCLSKEPSERPQSADELAARLAAVKTSELWTPARAEAWWDMNRPPAAGASVPGVMSA
jgi:hypothetical protein